MAKITRVFQNLFGRDGDQSHFGQFGSRVGGPGVYTKDPNTIQSLVAFVTNGWKDAINSGNKAAFLEDMNGLFLLIFRQLCSIFQDGVPVWDPSTPYYTGSVVRKDTTFELYGSLTDNNVGNALPSQTDNGNWKFLNPPSVAPGVMADFGGSSAPLGWLLCDGSVVAQASYPALYAAIGGNWNTGGEGAGNFRLPDIRGRATIGAGTGGGLSPRSLAQLLGEETHTLTTGEIPAHNHGVSDPGHAHSYSTNSDNSQFVNPGGTGMDHATGHTTGASTTGISINNAGGGGAHNNMQPSAVVTKIIKY